METDWCLNCGGHATGPYCSASCHAEDVARATYKTPSVPELEAAWDGSASVSSATSTLSRSPKAAPSSFLDGATPTDWFASRSPRQRTMAGSLAPPEEPQPVFVLDDAEPCSYLRTQGGNAWYFDHGSPDHGSEVVDHFPLPDFPLATSNATSGQSAAAARVANNPAIDAGVAIAAIEDILATIQRPGWSFRLSRSSDQFRGVVDRFVVMMGRRRGKKPEMQPQECWRESSWKACGQLGAEIQ